jgi:ABC-type Mn2+/Zn2+ transport system ATPase subunit
MMTMTETRPAAPLARIEGASVGWGRRVVLRKVEFEIRSGDYLGLVGPNGAGKSTLLFALLGLTRPIVGRVARFPGWRAGYVPQRDTIEPLFRFRAREVVAMAARAGSFLPFTGRKARARAAEEALDSVGMSGMAGRVFRDLSGGQKQRVLIARALVSGPSVLVLDEPTTGMDISIEADLLSLIRALRDERGLTIVLVSHSLHLVADEADRVGLLAGGTVNFGSPDEIISERELSAVYGRPVTVDELHGRRVVHVPHRARP